MRQVVPSAMHSEQVAASRYPVSPLSPKITAGARPTSPQAGQRMGNHGRQTTRNMHLNLGRYHPSNFPQADPRLSTGPPASSLLPRAPPALQMETPRLMRDKQREFLDRARLNSKLAASPFSIKPEAPRLDPLGSPKGNVTPLALEEAGDYFGAVEKSPVPSPGTRSPRSNSVSDTDAHQPNKSRKIDYYQA